MSNDEKELVNALADVVRKMSAFMDPRDPAFIEVARHCASAQAVIMARSVMEAAPRGEFIVEYALIPMGSWGDPPAEDEPLIANDEPFTPIPQCPNCKPGAYCEECTPF